MAEVVMMVEGEDDSEGDDEGDGEGDGGGDGDRLNTHLYIGTILRRFFHI